MTPLGRRPLLTRRRFAGLLLAGLASGGYAWQVEPRRLEVTRETLEVARLADGLDGLRIGLIADIHYAPDWQEPAMAAVVAALNAEDLDLIAIPGDFIDHDPQVLDPLAPLLGQLRARHGVFASIGNHDGWSISQPRLAKTLEKHGIQFLCNQSTRLNLRGQRLDIAATDSIWSGRIDRERTFAGTQPETTLSLVHEPDPFEILGADAFLQVSGHTHGGQCRVPLVGYAPVGVRYGRKYVYGPFTHPSGSRLFVTRGLGTVGMRVRFACTPEVAILTLRGV